MNIFTNDDYRRIQAWLKANAIKDSDFTISENTVPDEDILVITQNVSTIPTNYRIKIKDLLNSSLGKIVIDKITTNVVKVNNTLTVDAANVKLDNEKGTTLQDIIDWTETLEKATKGWNIEHQAPSIDEPTVRAKYVLKDSKGVPKGDVIKVYKDSAITNVYLGTTKDTCNENTGEVTKKPVQDNNEALSIVYRLDTGKYSLVNVPIGIFTREAEFDKYKGLGVTEKGQVFVKLASDVESSNYLHFNDMGEVSADGIENRILQDLGTIINSVANDGTMWGQYKKEEGTKDSPINEASRWGQYKQAEADRSELLNIVSSKVNQLEQEQIQGGVYDVSAHNDDAVFESLQSLLNSSNLSILIPTSVRHEGMTIRFIQGSEQSSDNKYVQYRLTTNEWSTDTDDWAISEEGILVENSEYIYIKTDDEGKILFGIKVNGDPYFGVGCPEQVKEYVEQKIADLSLDEYEDVVAFLSDYLVGDVTLKSIIDNLVNTKVDKVAGKSLIDEGYASSKDSIKNYEFMDVEIDNDGKILGGRKTNGNKFENMPIETPTVEISSVYDPEERLEVNLDEKGRIISYRKNDGTLVELNAEIYNLSVKVLDFTGNIPEQIQDYVEEYVDTHTPKSEEKDDIPYNDTMLIGKVMRNVYNPYKETKTNQFTGQMHDHCWTKYSEFTDRIPYLYNHQDYNAIYAEYGVSIPISITGFHNISSTLKPGSAVKLVDAIVAASAARFLSQHKNVGYDFMAITDYAVYGDVTQKPSVIPDNFLWLWSAYETTTKTLGVNQHMVVHNVASNSSIKYGQGTFNDIMKILEDEGCIVQWAHPTDIFTPVTPDNEVVETVKSRLRFMEVYDGISMCKYDNNGIRSDRTVGALLPGILPDAPYDQMLTQGNFIFCMAISDERPSLGRGSVDTDEGPRNTSIITENNAYNLKNGCIKVFGDNLTQKEIFNSLLAGNFYASSNADISIQSVVISNGTYTIDTGMADVTVEFLKENNTILDTVITSQGSTIASYTIQGNEKFVRARVYKKRNAISPNPDYWFVDKEWCIWTQPLFISNNIL